MKKALPILLLIICLLLSGCLADNTPPAGTTATTGGNTTTASRSQQPPDRPSSKPNDPPSGEQPPVTEKDDTSYGEELADLGFYDGYSETVKNEVVITALTGTKNAYTVAGDVITFNPLTADSVYTISGTWKGCIIINVGNDYKFDLELHGFSLISSTTNPITVKTGDEVAIVAKNEYKNYIYDTREAIDEMNTTLRSGAIHSDVDLEIGGKGELFVVSEHNNGIHSKKDLQVKNLTLSVVCRDNALKGNDSVELLACNTTLIAKAGDAIKTTDSTVSSKGNQRGNVTVTGGKHMLYAACDGIDAAHDVIIDDAATVLNIYTDKYSNYSDEITAVEKDCYFIRFPMDGYSFSVRYSNGGEDTVWVNAVYHSTVSGGMGGRYYYYTVEKKSDYSQMEFFVYAQGTAQGQDGKYAAATEPLTPNSAYDTLAFSMRGSSLVCGWTNYTTAVGGGMGGGMQEGNAEKGDRSAKGIKAENEVMIKNGTVFIKSYDDAVHVKNDGVLENGKTPKGNLTVSGGTLTVYSNDDGLHADGALLISNGSVSILNSYEGIEGYTVTVSGGRLSVLSRDDGINALAENGTAITVSGGEVYVYCSGDGIDSNSRTAFGGILFSGGRTVIITSSGGNSAIDSENGYNYTGGSVLALMPSGRMSEESLLCRNFDTVGKTVELSVALGNSVIVTVNGTEVLLVEAPCAIPSCRAIYLGASNAEISI